MYSVTEGSDGQINVHGTITGTVREVVIRGDGKGLRLWHIDRYTFMCVGTTALTLSLLGKDGKSVLWEGNDLDAAVRFSMHYVANQLMRRAERA